MVNRYKMHAWYDDEYDAPRWRMLIDCNKGPWVKWPDYESLESRHRDLVAALETIAAQDEGESPTSRIACVAAIARLALSKASP